MGTKNDTSWLRWLGALALGGTMVALRQARRMDLDDRVVAIIGGSPIGEAVVHGRRVEVAARRLERRRQANPSLVNMHRMHARRQPLRVDGHEHALFDHTERGGADGVTIGVDDPRRRARGTSIVVIVAADGAEQSE